MEVHIVSKEIVKPFSSTSQHLRTHKLSLLDLLAPPVYVPIIVFYSSAGEKSLKISDDHLKTSFSKTLTHFYPFAGRLKDGLFSIDCNDEGGLYVEAHVAGDMSVLLEEPEFLLLQKLLPCNPHYFSPEIGSQILLAAQVNHFNCGGTAISVCVWHAIADASAVASFLTSWAAITCGATASVFHGVTFDCTSLFPPQDIGSFSFRDFVKDDDSSSDVLLKRFVFDSSKLAILREVVANGPCFSRPTRVEAVAALIWGAVMAASNNEEEEEEEEEESNKEVNTATIAVDLRKRMVPPLPQLSIGNMYQSARANCSKNIDNMKDYNGLAGKLHDSIVNMNDKYIRMIHAGGGYFEFARKKTEGSVKNFKLKKIFSFSSWCRFPFYEADFGWGKPGWVGTALKCDRVAIFIDTKDGKGIEAWVALPKDDMLKFEQNSDIFAYASFKPTTY